MKTPIRPIDAAVLKRKVGIRKTLMIALIIMATTTVFFSMRHFEFINFDDDVYVFENAHLQKGLTSDSLLWSFTTVYAGHWHPLTWFSHMIDVQLFGLNAGPHHLTNLLFHVASAILLFLILSRMTHTFWQSAFVAALFALHPLRVESVAWVTERKDVLSTFFMMLTLGAYTFYCERPSGKRYAIALGFFIMGLMAKPMLVTLPFVLLLLDYWPLERIPLAEKIQTISAKTSKRQKKKGEAAEATSVKGQADLALTSIPWAKIWPLVREKMPFFALSVLASMAVVYAQKSAGAMTSLQIRPLDVRLMNALNSYILYMGKTIWPQNLSVFYPYPETLPLWQVLGAAAALILITGLIFFAAKRFPYLTVGWLWYIGTLIPVIGIVQVGTQAMADRFTYIPSIGLFIIATWGMTDLSTGWPRRKILLATMGFTVIALLMFTTWKQVHYWKDSKILFQHAIEATHNNYLAHNNLGDALSNSGRSDEAIRQFQQSLRIKPDYASAHIGLGVALAQQGRLEDAQTHFEDALRIRPNDEKALNNLGLVILHKGNADLAIAHFQNALRVKPDYFDVYINLGHAYAQLGMFQQSVLHLEKAISISSHPAEAHYNLGTVLLYQNKVDEAIVHFNEAVRLKPNYTKALNNLGMALMAKGAVGEAISYFQKVVSLQPDDKIARNNLAFAINRLKGSPNEKRQNK